MLGFDAHQAELRHGCVYAEIHALLDDMHAIMHAARGNGGLPSVGLAAPQVGAALRVIVMSSDPEKDTLKHRPPRRELINPKVVKVLNPKRKLELWENCLSLPGAFHLEAEPRKQQDWILKWLWGRIELCGEGWSCVGRAGAVWGGLELWGCFAQVLETETHR
jgi:hypothetical protein